MLTSTEILKIETDCASVASGMYPKHRYIQGVYKRALIHATTREHLRAKILTDFMEMFIEKGIDHPFIELAKEVLNEYNKS